MKLKNMFAGVLAASMMATMAAPAFATSAGSKVSFSPDPITDAIELTKIYNVTRGTAPAENLQFKLTYWKSENVVTGGTPNALVQEKTYNVDFTDNGSTTGLTTGEHDKTFSIDIQNDLGIKKVGKYYFKIQEVPGDKASVTYDSHTRVLVVSAVNKVDADKKLEDGLDFYAALYELNADGELGEKIEGDEAFENDYGKCNVFKIDLSKEVRGEFGDRDLEFTFNIVFEPGEGKDEDDYYGATVVKNGKSEIWEIDGTTQHSVTLKHGDIFTIENLPEGVTYTITEDFTDNEWSTTVNDVDGKTVTDTISKDAQAKYVNRHKGVPDTGVIVDNAPYFVLLTIVAAGSVVMFLQKRRHTED